MAIKDNRNNLDRNQMDVTGVIPELKNNFDKLIMNFDFYWDLALKSQNQSKAPKKSKALKTLQNFKKEIDNGNSFGLNLDNVTKEIIPYGKDLSYIFYYNTPHSVDRFSQLTDKPITTLDEECPNVMLGDASGDGILNILDIVQMVNRILNSEYIYVADINQDGYLDVLDIVILLNVILAEGNTNSYCPNCGCQNLSADNYNPSAIYDCNCETNGNEDCCVLPEPVYACWDVTADNCDPQCSQCNMGGETECVGEWEDYCTYERQSGCLDAAACNYEGGSEVYVCDYDSHTDICVDNGWSKSGDIYYNPSGTQLNDVTDTEGCCCLYQVFEWLDCQGNCENDVDGDGYCDEQVACEDIGLAPPDCQGVCGGSSQIDSCGECGGTNTTGCKDEFGNNVECGSGMSGYCDCYGNVRDMCSYCNGNNQFNDSLGYYTGDQIDCSGTCNWHDDYGAHLIGCWNGTVVCSSSSCSDFDINSNTYRNLMFGSTDELGIPLDSFTDGWFPQKNFVTTMMQFLGSVYEGLGWNDDGDPYTDIRNYLVNGLEGVNPTSPFSGIISQYLGYAPLDAAWAVEYYGFGDVPLPGVDNWLWLNQFYIGQEDYIVYDNQQYLSNTYDCSQWDFAGADCYSAQMEDGEHFGGWFGCTLGPDNLYCVCANPELGCLPEPGGVIGSDSFDFGDNTDLDYWLYYTFKDLPSDDDNYLKDRLNSVYKLFTTDYFFEQIPLSTTGLNNQHEFSVSDLGNINNVNSHTVYPIANGSTNYVLFQHDETKSYHVPISAGADNPAWLGNIYNGTESFIMNGVSYTDLDNWLYTGGLGAPLSDLKTKLNDVYGYFVGDFFGNLIVEVGSFSVNDGVIDSDGTDYIMFPYNSSYSYVDPSADNIGWFEGLITGGASNTIGDSNYAIFTWQNGYEYVIPDADNLTWLSTYYSTGATDTYGSSLDSWLMTSNIGAPVANIENKLSAVLEEFGGTDLPEINIYIKGNGFTYFSIPFPPSVGTYGIQETIENYLYEEDGVTPVTLSSSEAGLIIQSQYYDSDGTGVSGFQQWGGTSWIGFGIDNFEYGKGYGIVTTNIERDLKLIINIE